MTPGKNGATALPQPPGGAASHAEEDWHQINWSKAHQTVRRLQARIVQATQDGKWNKVKALQRLLTHSFSGKALAVRRVTENQGKRTPGVDRVTWGTAEHRIGAVHALRQRGYRPQPVNGQVNWPGVMPSELAALCPSLHVVCLLERTG